MTHYGLKFDTVETARDLRQLGDFMRTQVGDYDATKHDAWIEGVCLPAIAREERRALAWWRDGTMVGDAVVKVIGPDVAELKNFRVAGHDELRGRGMGAFLLRQALAEAKELLDEKGLITTAANTIRVQLDTTEGGEAQTFFTRQGFTQTGTAELYTPGKAEAIMQIAVEL